MNLSQAVAIVLLVLLQAMASAAFAQKKESYTGTMTLPDDIPMIVLEHTGDYKPGETNGDATYEYYLNPQGDRVKDGKFDFTCMGYTGGIYSCNISGDYKDGKKNGYWTFTNGGGVILNGNGQIVDNPSSNTKCALFTYKDDIRKGEFIFAVVCDGCYVDMAGHLDNDHVVGKAQINYRSFYQPDNIFLKVEAYFDQDGNPENEWIMEETAGKRMKYYLKYENGILVNVQRNDESTGQRTVVVDSKADASKSKYLTDFSLYDYALEYVNGTEFYLSKDSIPYKKMKKTIEYRLDCDGFEGKALKRIATAFKNMDFNVIDRELEVLIPSEKEYWACKVDTLASSVVAGYNALYSKVMPLLQSKQMYYVPAGKKHDLFNDADVIVRDYLGITDNFNSYTNFSEKLSGYRGIENGAWSRSGAFRRLEYDKHSCQNEKNMNVADVKHWLTTWNSAKAELARLSAEADKQIEARAKMDEVTQNMIRVDANMSGKQKKYFTKLVERRDAVGIIEFFANPEIATQK